MLLNSYEDKMNHNEKKLKEINLRFEKLNEEIESFFKDLGLTPEQLSSYMENRENFCQASWEELQKQKKMLDQKLNLEMKGLNDPIAAQKNRETLNVDRHWIFVK